MIKGVNINKYKIEKIKLINKNANIIKYKLSTRAKEIILNISKENNSKIMMLEFMKTPFYILTYKKIDNEIKINDSFEISNDEVTLELECQATCGINFKSEK